MICANINAVEAAALHDGTAEVWTLLAHPGGGSSLSYLNDGYIRPGVGVPPHSHQEEEVFYVTHGRGRLVIEGDETDLESGDAVHIPSNAVHAVENTGTHPLRLVVVGFRPGRSLDEPLAVVA